MHEGTSVTRRLLKHTVIDIETGCWNWSGAIGNHGYGVLMLWDGKKRQTKLAHRVSYERFVGPFPKGLYSDHLCRNRRCINPKHLEPVTLSENIRRGEAGKKTGAKNRAKTHCPKGHPYSGDNLLLETQHGGKYQRRACKTCISLRAKHKRRTACH